MDLEQIITSGGDERIHLHNNGLNRYYSNPVQYEGVFNRGSCTCNTLTPDSMIRMQELLGTVDNDNFENHAETLRNELKSLINVEDNDKFELFFAPSGSELNYYPILFSLLINPDKTIRSLVTCPEELGSGSLKAASALNFSSLNQFDVAIEKGAPIGDIDIEVETYPARDRDGRIIDHRQALLDRIREVGDTDSLIGNLVIGSKSGIEDNVTIIPRAQEPVLWVVDMCQLRVPKHLISRLLDLNVMIMVTGSKFHQAPPFCGALLVPKSVVARLKHPTDPNIVEPFTRIFSKYDIPGSLPWLQEYFPDFKNYGLLYRWEAALVEMKLIDRFDVDKVISMINTWHNFILATINEHKQYFELMPDMEITNKSIISFRIFDKNNCYLDEKQLREVYKEVSINEHEGLGEANKLLIGQPVSYDDRSFIRLALGSYPIRTFLRDGFDEGKERRIIEIILDTTKKLYW